jgi:hypothetical protein
MVRPVAENIDVRASRIPDRNRLLHELTEAGLDAHPVGEVDIEVRCRTDRESMSDDVFRRVEEMVMRVGSQFVPIKHDDVIYVRPPVG